MTQDRKPRDVGSIADALDTVALGATGDDALAGELSELAAELRDAAVVAVEELTTRDPDGLLTAALARAQGKFPPIPKGKTATVNSPKGNYSYAYADLADVLEAVRPVLAAEGLAVTQPTEYRDGRMILRTILRHTAGGRMSSEVELAANPSSAQAFGGALTYLRRYQVTTLLGIQADEDADAHNTAAPDERRDAPAVPAWALEASLDRKRELVDALEPLIGRDRAKALALDVRAGIGLVPDVLVSFAIALRGYSAEAGRAAQDAAAEAPDDPPVEALDDPPVEELVDPPLDDDPVDDPPAEELVDPPIYKDPGPLPGTIPVDLTGMTTAGQIAALKAAGCKCENPLAGGSDDCPIAGHGIPF